MLQARLRRRQSTDEGTEGFFSCPERGFTSYTLELPWRDNRPNVSSIPAGIYLCRLVKSPRFGWVYQVCDVKGRSHVLHHSGNVAGDRAKGYATNVLGCILHGKKRGFLAGQRAVLVSKATIRRLHRAMGGEDFELTIEDGG